MKKRLTMQEKLDDFLASSLYTFLECIETKNWFNFKAKRKSWSRFINSPANKIFSWLTRRRKNEKI